MFRRGRRTDGHPGPVRRIDSVVKPGSRLKQNTGGFNLSGHRFQKHGEPEPRLRYPGDSCAWKDLCCLSSPCIALTAQESERGNINGRRSAVPSTVSAAGRQIWCLQSDLAASLQTPPPAAEPSRRSRAPPDDQLDLCSQILCVELPHLFFQFW